MKKYTLLSLLIVFLICGCSKTKLSINDSIQPVSIEKLNQLADDFVRESYDYLYQFEINYQTYEVRKIELNYYKEGKLQDNLLCFMREENDSNISNIQYIYLAYNFNDERKRYIDSYIYLYGPKQPNKYNEEYSGSVQPETLVVEFDRLKKIYPIEKIDYEESKFYINPIVLDAPVNNELNDDVTTVDLIQRGYELLVLEVTY